MGGTVTQWLLLGGAALLASTLAAVAGFGGAAVLLPALVAMFGVRDAIPILTVAQLVGNGSRVWFNRRELALPVVGWFALGAVPLALVGGVLFATAPLGALMAPFFLAYGLVKGAYIGTEALATVVMHLAKLAAYQGTAILTARAVAVGLALGPIMILGSYVGKRVLDRLPERVFVAIIELVLIGSGVWLLIAV